MVTVLSVLRFTDLDYPFAIFKYFVDPYQYWKVSGQFSPSWLPRNTEHCNESVVVIKTWTSNVWHALGVSVITFIGYTNVKRLEEQIVGLNRKSKICLGEGNLSFVNTNIIKEFQ